jgi:hypothetical protein
MNQPEHPQPTPRPQLSLVSPNGKLPFWISPWSIGLNPDGKAYHKCTVAHSRASRHKQRVEITVLDEALADVPHKERQRIFATKIVEALQSLGIVNTPESKPATV